MKRSKKESFILYLDSRNLLDCLDYEKKGRLFEAIFTYVAGDKVPSLSPDVNMAFISIKTYLDKDREKYLEKCEKNSKNQKARWKNRNVYDRIQTYSNDTDNDTDNDNESDNESGEYIYINQPMGPEGIVKRKRKVVEKEGDLFAREKQKKPNQKPKEEKPPTMDEVRAEFLKRGLSENEAEYFYYYYDAQGWVTSSGQKIQRLDSMVNRWISNNHKNKGDGKSNGSSREERMRDAAKVMERILARVEEETHTKLAIGPL